MKIFNLKLIGMALIDSTLKSFIRTSDDYAANSLLGDSWG